MEPISTLATLPTKLSGPYWERICWKATRAPLPDRGRSKASGKTSFRDAQYLGGRLQGTAEQLDSTRRGERTHRQGQQQQRREHLPHHPQTVLHPFGKSRQQVNTTKHRHQEYQTEQGRNDQIGKEAHAIFLLFCLCGKAQRDAIPLAAAMPVKTDRTEESQTAGRISIGEAEPACSRSMAAVVGIS